MLKHALVASAIVLAFASASAAQANLLSTVQRIRADYPNPMSDAQKAELLNRVAWEHRAEGWGLLRKDGGSRCPAPQGVYVACDILVYAPTAWHFDVLIDGQIPNWGDDGPCDPSVSGCDMARFVPPVRPAQDRGASAPDLNNDGHTDLIWQNDTTRQVTVFYMSGAGGNDVQGMGWLWSANQAGWTMAATADFNADGIPDMVWVNDTTRQVTVIYMGGAQGNVIQGWNWLSSTGLPGWTIVAAADFDNDGVPDIVGQEDATGRVAVVYMSGAQGNVVKGYNVIWPNNQPGWRVVAVRDFNGDGVPDLVWQEDATRIVNVVYMTGAQGNVIMGWSPLWPSALPGWRVVGASDLNADGHPDLVWQNDSTRQVTVVYFGGALGNVNIGWNWLWSPGVPGWRALTR